jgi:hypothetical protein
MSVPPTLKIWRLHPKGVGVKPAEATLGGMAPSSARQHCGPYMHVNGAGFYLYSPIDIDLSYNPDRKIPWDWNMPNKQYTDEEIDILRSMPIKHPQFELDMIKRRSKLFISGAADEPAHTAQIWTGCIFQTPPGWSLWIRGPINRELATPFRIEEAIIESDFPRRRLGGGLRGCGRLCAFTPGTPVWHGARMRPQRRDRCQLCHGERESAAKRL